MSETTPLPNLIVLERKFIKAIENAETLEQVESIRREFLGRKGIFDATLENLKNLPHSERQKFGKDLNLFKEKVQGLISEKKSECEQKRLEEALKSENQDLSLPSFPFLVGKAHPLTQVLDEITEIFVGMGFSVAEGPEIETDENNFGALNIPADHPARDMHDTFYLQPPSDPSSLSTPVPAIPSLDKLLLRTHTSPVQIRVMRNQPPPIHIIAPGKVYRHEAIDAAHSTVFHQIEGLVVDQSISLSDLKGTLELFSKNFFGENVKTRFRPSYFPFVEPGAEVDISCALCPSTGRSQEKLTCPVCKGSGWIEMLGAGMVHPNVFNSVGYDPEEVSGFAFGMGIERIAMVRHGINDMRLFFENHLDFLSQF